MQHRYAIRKCLALMAISAAVVFGVAGCSNSGGSASTSTSSESTPSGNSSGSPAAAPVHTPIEFEIVKQARTDLDKYDTFTYETATITGLSSAAVQAVNAEIASQVQFVVDKAVADNLKECSFEDKCGYFQQTLKQISCKAPYLCLKQTINSVPVGAATSDEQVTVLVVDSSTGEILPQEKVGNNGDSSSFIASVNHAIYEFQRTGNLYDAAYPYVVTEQDIAAVAPVESGLRVWIAKYSAAPGSEGVVALTVPYPKDLTTQALAAGWGPELPEAGDMIDYLCYDTAAHLPNLPPRNSDPSGVSTMRNLLTELGYKAGPLDDGWNDQLITAVRQFQDDQALVVDGTVGRQTWNRLREMFCWQWVPTDPGSVNSLQDNEAGTGANSESVQGLTTVPRLIGLSNNSVRNTIANARLNFGRQQLTNTDSSLSALTNGQCWVINQSPGPAQEVPVGTTVDVLVRCPSTGMSGGIGGYNGPAPPPAWTG